MPVNFPHHYGGFLIPSYGVSSNRASCLCNPFKALRTQYPILPVTRPDGYGTVQKRNQACAPHKLNVDLSCKAWLDEKEAT
ncbi:hypothetical protein VTL71DRAFT_1619, partial [Oculimacula yallundae]